MLYFVSVTTQFNAYLDIVAAILEYAEMFVYFPMGLCNTYLKRKVLYSLYVWLLCYAIKIYLTLTLKNG